MNTTTPRILITDQDFQRLSALVSITDDERSDMLDEELSRANIIAQADVPSSVVTMNSKVKFLDQSNGQTSEMTLVYPQDANLDEGRISIFAPVGIALLGLSVGQAIDWKMPNGQIKKLQVEQVVFQPEAAGQWEL